MKFSLKNIQKILKMFGFKYLRKIDANGHIYYDVLDIDKRWEGEIIQYHLNYNELVQFVKRYLKEY